MNVKPEWAIPYYRSLWLAGSYIHQVFSPDSQVTALAGTVDKIESRLGPIDNTNVKRDAQIGALIQQQVEPNTISNELNKTLSDVNGSIRELNTAIQYLKEDHDTAK